MTATEYTPETSIKKFFDGCNVFITGGTGFLGRVLIEKLLRTCTGVEGIYVIVRSRRGVPPSKRLEDLTNCKIFDLLKSTNPEVLKKIHALEGDVQKLRLGLSDADIEIVKKCTIIFHCAASVRFDDPLTSALFMNTRGTLEMCKIAEQISNLKVLVYVSTSFVQPQLHGSEEIFYPAVADWRRYIQYAETFDDGMMDALEKKLTNHTPNTYTFTKHLSEQICKFYKDSKDLPIVIYRPSIIAGSEHEPFPGWLDNLNGPFAYCFTALLGILHVSMVDKRRKLDYVPVDICVKGSIVAAWKTWKERKTTKMIPIYNSTSIKNPSFVSINDQQIHIKYPSMNTIMYIEVTHVNCSFIAWTIKIVEQIIPALILDGILRMNGKKPKLLKFQRIIMESEKALVPFNRCDFKFINHKFIDLTRSIPEHELEEFFITEKNHNESKIMKDVYLNFLENMLHEDISDFSKARRRQKIVTFIWKIYQFGVYGWLFYWIYGYLENFLAGFDIKSIFVEN